eukprot:3977063-Prymnesium_polylepis.1
MLHGGLSSAEVGLHVCKGGAEVDLGRHPDTGSPSAKRVSGFNLRARSARRNFWGQLAYSRTVGCCLLLEKLAAALRAEPLRRAQQEVQLVLFVALRVKCFQRQSLQKGLARPSGSG